MKYTNSEMKLDQLIGYFNQKKINLVPAFQRGHVWPIKLRQGLVANIVRGRPIPAIFLYKEADGTKYTYNILDGKQRLESLILFVGSAHPDLKVADVKQYFYGSRERDMIGFPINLDGKKVNFSDLGDNVVRDFREYAVPTIEIELEDTNLDEIIDLFVDINQYGVKVNRFDIVKAMGENPLLKSVFDLIAVQQKRKSDIFYKMKRTDFSRSLDKLQIMQNLPSQNAKVDRMWERLLEIVLFNRTKRHRAPAQILKSFIHGRGAPDKAKVPDSELNVSLASWKFSTNSRRALHAVTMFPMTRSAQDLLMNAPSPANQKQLKELHLRVVYPEKA